MIRDEGNGWLAPADDNDPYRRRILGRSGLTWLLIKGGKHADVSTCSLADDEGDADEAYESNDAFDFDTDAAAIREWPTPELRAIPPLDPSEPESEADGGDGDTGPDDTSDWSPVIFDAPLQLPADHPMPMQVRRMLGMFVGSLSFDDEDDDDSGSDVGTDNAVDRWLDIDIVGVVFDVSPRTIRRWMRAGRFPRPGRGGGRGRMCYWRESVVRDNWARRAECARRAPRRSEREDG